MAIQIKSTSTVEISPHCIVFGPAKSGKTRLIPTLENPIICSTDSGLASIRGFNHACVECNNWNEVASFNEWATSDSAERNQFKEIVYDDLTEMAGLYLVMALAANKDGRKAYGQMGEEMMYFFREMRKLKQQTVVLLSKEERIQNEKGELLYSPMLPGQALQPLVPYMFGQIYHMEAWTAPDGVVHEVLRCKRNNQIEAGDRSGKLGEIEFANLGEINRKVMS